MTTSTITSGTDLQNAAGQQSKPAANSTSTTELAQRKLSLFTALRHFADFPIPGIDFVDILPLFSDPTLHDTLITALEQQVLTSFGGVKPDVIVALDARGFLFGPSLALRFGAGFAPVRKKGKLPGPTVEASFKKEYGEDWFQMQSDAVKKGDKVLIVDDIIATGGSAAAAGSLVEQLGADLIGFVFILELDFLKGRDKLSKPVATLLSDKDKEALTN